MKIEKKKIRITNSRATLVGTHVVARGLGTAKRRGDQRGLLLKRGIMKLRTGHGNLRLGGSLQHKTTASKTIIRNATDSTEVRIISDTIRTSQNVATTTLDNAENGVQTTVI
jgi:hypothetical protein